MGKRKIILDTSLKMFVENGFHGTATAKIAKEANIANGTLFQYFKTKEELIVAVFTETKSALLNEIDNTPLVDDIEEMLKMQFTSSVNWAMENTLKFQYIQQFYSSPYIGLIAQNEMQKYIEPHLRLIEKGIKNNKIKDLDIDLVYQIFSSQTFGVIQYLKSNKKNKKNVIEITFQLLWNMIKK
ncbi:MAG: TetR/AcrR family transcriptional regulator [Leadbetterella sp.]